MITSMTGFAAATVEDEHATVSITLRAVNHRYLDVQVRAPALVSPLEPALRSTVQRRLSRGRVEVAITVQPRQAPAIHVEVNDAVVAALHEALESARARGLVAGALTPGDLLRLPQAIAVREQSADAGTAGAAIQSAIERCLDDALGELEAMRAREGRFLENDLEARRRGLTEAIDGIEAAADSGRANTEARLARRVQELAFEGPVDPALIAQEIVRAAARSDISEELVRFRGHLEHWRAMADSPDPCGRRLDFLLQEMNREVNTIASKAEGQGLSELVVHVKAELEKMREQVQNVE